MGRAGRVSGAELQVMRGSIAPLERVARFEPPADLTEFEAGLFREIVQEWPADWFKPGTQVLLAQYCRHCSEIEAIGVLLRAIKAEPEFDAANYDRTLVMRDRETRAASSLATRLRLTPQASRDKSNKPGPVAGRPWET